MKELSSILRVLGATDDLQGAGERHKLVLPATAGQGLGSDPSSEEPSLSPLTGRTPRLCSLSSLVTSSFLCGVEASTRPGF